MSIKKMNENTREIVMDYLYGVNNKHKMDIVLDELTSIQFEVWKDRDWDADDYDDYNEYLDELLDREPNLPPSMCKKQVVYNKKYLYNDYKPYNKKTKTYDYDTTLKRMNDIGLMTGIIYVRLI
jgi:hypothetical protein